MKNKRSIRKPKEVDARTFSVRFPEDVLAEVDAEAKRLERTRTWVILRIVKEKYGLVESSNGQRKAATV